MMVNQLEIDISHLWSSLNHIELIVIVCTLNVLRDLPVEILDGHSNLRDFRHEIASEALVVQEALLVVLNPEFLGLSHCVAIKESSSSEPRQVLRI